MELGGGQWDVMEDEYNIGLLDLALENGISTFDTAEGYGKGHSEEIVGQALAGRREKCVIATKVSKEHLMPADIRRAIEGSLKRLNTSYVDLYYIHWPNDAIPIEKTIGEFNKLKNEGLIRAIGVSNFSLKQLKEAMKFGIIDALQPEYNLLQRDIESDLLPFCLENSISVLSYNSIAKGILSGAFHLSGSVLKASDFRNTKPLFQPENLEKERPLILLLDKIARQKNATIAQVAISWQLHQKGLSSAIVGTQNKKHFVENIQSEGIDLTSAELNAISSQSRQVIASLS